MADKYIILDTNIYATDFLLTGKSFKILIEGLDKINGVVVIPEIVFEEVINKYKEYFEDNIKKVKSATNKLKKQTVYSHKLDIQFSENIVDKNVQKYRQYLKDRITVNRISLLEIPNVDHKEIIKRCLDKKKPFNIHGSGYRDYLIWKSVLFILKKYSKKQIFFITMNTKDFFEQNKLHSDLIEDIKKADRKRIFNYQNLNEFNNDYILPILKELDTVKDLLNAGKYKNFDLDNWVDNSLVDLIESEDKWNELKEIGFDFPEDLGTITKQSIEHINSITVNDVNSFPSDELLISFTVNCNIYLEIDFSNEDYNYSHEYLESLGYPIDYYNPMPDDFENTFEIDISIFVLTNGELTGSEINWIGSDNYNHIERYYY